MTGPRSQRSMRVGCEYEAAVWGSSSSIVGWPSSYGTTRKWRGPGHLPSSGGSVRLLTSLAWPGPILRYSVFSSSSIVDTPLLPSFVGDRYHRSSLASLSISPSRSRKLHPNVDFYSGIIYQAMGFKPQMFTVLFAIPRTAGWLAQWQEMVTDPEQKIARPRQVYTGHEIREFVPPEKRRSALAAAAD